MPPEGPGPCRPPCHGHLGRAGCGGGAPRSRVLSVFSGGRGGPPLSWTGWLERRGFPLVTTLQQRCRRDHPAGGLTTPAGWRDLTPGPAGIRPPPVRGCRGPCAAARRRVPVPGPGHTAPVGCGRTPRGSGRREARPRGPGRAGDARQPAVPSSLTAVPRAWARTVRAPGICPRQAHPFLEQPSERGRGPAASPASPCHREAWCRAARVSGWSGPSRAVMASTSRRKWPSAVATRPLSPRLVPTRWSTP